VTDLARAQTSLASLPAGSIVATRAFDEELLSWEIQHFREWALEARGITLTGEDRTRFDALARRLASRIAGWPRSFVHRDYQSRNLMVLPSGEQAVIDFQDALLGPRQYDLVALLRDSYVELEPGLVEAMLRRYLDRFHEAGGPRFEYAPFRAVFDLLTVQRKLKDAGRFVFIDRVKKNPGFLGLFATRRRRRGTCAASRPRTWPGPAARATRARRGYRPRTPRSSR